MQLRCCCKNIVMLLRGVLAHLCAPAAGPPLAAACSTAPGLTTSRGWPDSSTRQGKMAAGHMIAAVAVAACAQAIH